MVLPAHDLDPEAALSRVVGGGAQSSARKAGDGRGLRISNDPKGQGRRDQSAAKRGNEDEEFAQHSVHFAGRRAGIPIVGERESLAWTSYQCPER